MKKIFYNSRLAKMLLYFSNCHTIMFGGFVHSKLNEEEMTQSTRNHECVHARQWVEMTVLSGMIILIPVSALDLSVWWILLSSMAFYIWYVTEWAFKGILYSVLNDEWDCKKRNAYEDVSFEREARFASCNPDYLENANYFAWLKEI